jgi:hypothetical protein
MEFKTDFIDTFFETLKGHIKKVAEKFIPKPEHTSRDSTEVEVKREFENHSNIEVAVVDRNNMVFTFPAQQRKTIGHGYFIIRDIYFFKSGYSASRFYNNLVKRQISKGYSGEMIETIIERFTQHQSNNGNDTHLHMFGIEFTIDTKHFDEHPWIYMDNADVVIGRDNSVSEMSHVASESGIRQMTLLSLLQQSMQDKFSHAVVYDIVDNERVNEKYFSSMFAAVPDLCEVKRFEVKKRRPVQSMENIKQGVRRAIVTRGDDNETMNIKLDSVPLEEAESIGIYKSQEAALTNGRPELLQQVKVTQMAMELETLRNENAKQKERTAAEEQKYKEKNQAVDNHIETIKALRQEVNSLQKLREDAESFRLKTEREKQAQKAEKKKQKEDQQMRKQNNEFEKKSIKRKDKSEKTKFSLGMIASIASLAVGLFTLFKRA